MSINGGGGFDLDNFLEDGLQRHVGDLQGPSPLPAQSAYHAVFTFGGSAVSVFSMVSTAITTKVAAGAAAVVLVGGAAAGTVVTGSPNPVVWGQTVVAAVQGCKVTEATSDGSARTASSARDNVGQCVSAAARKKGEAERAEHSKVPTGHSTGKPSDVTGGKPAEMPGGKPSAVPGGKPSDVPGGKPSGVPGGKPSDVPGGKPSGVPGGRPTDVPPTGAPGHKP